MLHELGRILVVDDDELLGEVAKEYLCAAGLQVTLCLNGAEALVAIEAEKPDIVLMDIQMPVLDGFETTVQLRQKFDFDELPILMMTALEDMESISRAYDVGATDFFAKPIVWTVLLQRLRYMLRMVHTLKVERTLKREMQWAQKNRTIAAMTNGLAHDLNNQLQIISSTTEVLELNGYVSPEGVAGVGRIQASVVRGQELMEQLIGIGTNLSAASRSLNLNDEFVRILHLLRSTMRETVEVELNLAPDLQLIRSNTLEVDQILVALLLNASEAMPRGGTLTITTRNLSNSCIGENCIQLVVADTGKGILPDDINKIYEPFYSTKKPEEGVGMGLTTTSEIVSKLNGVIDCNSQPAVGTEFVVSLPSILSLVV